MAWYNKTQKDRGYKIELLLLFIFLKEFRVISISFPPSPSLHLPCLWQCPLFPPFLHLNTPTYLPFNQSTSLSYPQPTSLYDPPPSLSPPVLFLLLPTISVDSASPYRPVFKASLPFSSWPALTLSSLPSLLLSAPLYPLHFPMSLSTVPPLSLTIPSLSPITSLLLVQSSSTAFLHPSLSPHTACPVSSSLVPSPVFLFATGSSPSLGAVQIIE